MATFSKQKVNSAVEVHSKLDVSGTHVTSSSFMEFQPVFYRHMVAGEHLRGSINAVSRLAPVAVPCYGRCRLNLRSFFVPFDMVMPNFNDMLVNTVASNYDSSSLVDQSPYFVSNELLQMFLNCQEAGIYPLVEVVTGNSVYDFIYSTDHYRFTEYGRYYYKILVSLGYQLVLSNNKTYFNFSALPLLCYAKVFVDYYGNHAYENSSDYLLVKRLFTYNDPTTPLVLTYNDIFNLLKCCRVVCYDGGHDVYVNAWDNPVAPNSGNYSPVNVSDITTSSGNPVVTSDINGTPYMEIGQSYSIGSQYIHDMLKAMSDYFKRNQLSGSLAVQRFLSNYGVKLDNKEIKRSYYLGSHSVDIDFGSVMQTANTSNTDVSNLGDYAGVGFGRGGLDVDFTCDNFGMFIVIATIVPASDLVQGFDKNNLHVNRLDFYNQNFDNLGCDAVTKGEVYVSRNSAFVTNDTDYLGVFGFAPRYYEYKQGRSFLSGDYNVPSAMIGGNAWHLFRLFDDGNFISQIDGVTHSLNFTRGVDKGQYDRIFQFTDDSVDKFYLVVHAALQAYSPVKSLFDTYDFESAGKVLDMNGNSATVN